MDFGGVCVFQKQMTGLSFPSFASEYKRDDRPRRAFCAGAFLIAFSQGYLVMPTHGSILSRLMVGCNVFAPGSPETNLRNKPKNIVRTEAVNTVTRYSERFARLLPRAVRRFSILGWPPFLGC